MKRKVDDNISVETKKIIYKKNCRLRNPPTKIRRKWYSKEIFRNTGYDFLEYYSVIRRFVVWKYNLLDQDTLELLYYLHPRAYFTNKDYRAYPMRWGWDRWRQLKEEDFIEQVFPEQKRDIVYKLSDKSKDIVKHVHQLLTGEREIPNYPRGNGLLQANGTPAKKRYKGLVENMKEVMKSRADDRVDLWQRPWSKK